MKKHYVLNLNPQANSEWDRCILRNPITGARPDLTKEIAKALNNQAGSYLVKVSLKIEVLEQNISQPINAVDLTVIEQNLARKMEKLAC